MQILFFNSYDQVRSLAKKFNKAVREKVIYKYIPQIQKSIAAQGESIQA